MAKQNPAPKSALASRSIDENGPGSVLRDFEMLLGFVEQGLPTAGKYSLLPMARLTEIDQLMTRPLRPRLKRPQQKSFPHLNGLYLLLRATGLGVPESRGKTSAILTLDPAMHEQWLRLNPTERYFNLLEAWMRRGAWEVVGLRDGRGMDRVGWDAIGLWNSFSEVDHLSRRERERMMEVLLYGAEQACTLALFELFGLVTVERGEPREGQNWLVTDVRPTPFGDELLQIVFDQMQRELLAYREPAADFGAWQPALKPFFPEWVNNLEFPEPGLREGVFYFKVSLGKPWRRIAIPAGADLEQLAGCIIKAFDFDGDHLYGFDFTGRDGRRLRVAHPYIDDAPVHTDEVAIGELPLRERQSMRFLYDYGANWQFDVRLEKIETEEAGISRATVVESRGESPAEYGDEDEDEW